MSAEFLDFVEKLLKLDIDNKKAKSMAAIHRCVDVELARKIDDVVKAHTGGNTSIGHILGTFAFILGSDIGNNAPTQDSVCDIADQFGDYVHNMAHIAFEKSNPVGGKKH